MKSIIVQKAAHLGYGRDWYTYAYLRSTEYMGTYPFFDSAPDSNEWNNIQGVHKSAAITHWNSESIEFRVYLGEYNSFVSTEDLTLYSENFCIDAWVYFDTAPLVGTWNYICLWTAKFIFYVLSDMSMNVNINGVSSALSYNIGARALAEWHHYAVSRVGQIFNLYVDGEMVDTYDAGSVINFAFNKDVTGIANSEVGVTPTNGMYIEDWRFSKGHSRTLNLNKFPIPNRSY
jgi:hypothetical protein